MKRFSAQYVITNSGHPLRRAVVNTENDGTIISIENKEGALNEEHSIEFYNGIIIPGFINCHCHLELSYLRNKIPEGTGLALFIKHVRDSRKSDQSTLPASSADNIMYNEGIVLCADICNTANTFELKKDSRIKYINLIEAFGLDPEKATRRMNELSIVADEAKRMGLPFSYVPHSAYSLSLTLFRLLKKESSQNRVTSIHFMESESEESFLDSQTGPLKTFYEKSGLIPEHSETADKHENVILNEITDSGNLVLVHNTFVDRELIRKIRERKNLYWCICPASNLYIEKRLPNIQLLLEEDCKLVIGTDSLASNSNLSILNELKIMQNYLPGIPIEDLIKWATYNGAEALDEIREFGSIEPGKKPGLLLIGNVDLQNMKLLPDSYVRRLI